MSDEKMDAVSAWGEVARRLEAERDAARTSEAALREENETGKTLVSRLLARFFAGWPAGVRETWEAAHDNGEFVCVLRRMGEWVGEGTSETVAPCIQCFREVKGLAEQMAALKTTRDEATGRADSCEETGNRIAERCVQAEAEAATLREENERLRGALEDLVTEAEQKEYCPMTERRISAARAALSKQPTRNTSPAPLHCGGIGSRMVACPGCPDCKTKEPTR